MVAEFFGFLKMFVGCGTVFFVVMVVLLALPQSRLRCVGLEMAKYGMACGLVLMWVSPVDVIPGVIPIVGWLDDIGYIIGAIGAVGSGLGEREKRLMYEQIELEELRSRVNSNSSPEAVSQN